MIETLIAFKNLVKELRETQKAIEIIAASDPEEVDIDLYTSLAMMEEDRAKQIDAMIIELDSIKLSNGHEIN